MAKGNKLNEEQIGEIRELVKLGAFKCRVAEKFGVHLSTISYHTRDLATGRKMADSTREKIIKRVLETGDRRGAAEEFKISYQRVCGIVKDLSWQGRRGNHCIRDSTLRILQEIDRNGYVIPNTEFGSGVIDRSYRTLINYTPNMIRKVSRRHHVIIFYEARKIEAFRAFMGQRYNRIVSWKKYKAIMAAFHICKSTKESRELLGKMGFADYENPKRMKFKKLEEGVSNHQNSSDLGRFLLSDVL